MLYIKRILTKIIELLFFRNEVKKAQNNSSFLIHPQSVHELKMFEEKHLNKILASSATKTVFYNAYKSKSLNQFPLMDKQMIRECALQLRNSDYLSYKKFNFTTGGSTGEPFHFEIARICGLVNRYHSINFYKKIGYKKNDRVFSIDGVQIPVKLLKSNIYWKRETREELPHGSIHISAIQLNKVSAIHYYNFLEKERPEFIRSYPSAISELAYYMNENNLKLSFRFKGIVLSAESILDWQITLLKKVFDSPVYGQYGHSEMCVFAYTEPDSLKYTCSPYYGYVEILNEKGLHVKEGEVGNIVVTNYYNEAQYFIRYITGDLAEYGGCDRFGFPILNRILGREQDFVYDEEKNKINITALVFGSHYHSFENILKWQIKQREYGKVEFLIVKGKSYTNSDEQELRNSFLKIGLKSVFNYVDSIPLTLRGKHRLVINEITG